MRIKTCFVWRGLTCPGVLLHPCAACRSTLLGKSIQSQAGTSNPLPPKILAHERRRMDLSIPVLAIVSSSICMRMRVGVFGERERERVRERGREGERERERERGRMRERGREREMDLHSFLDPFSSFISMRLSPCPWIWVPPATRRCGLARGGSPSAALAPATAVTRRASEAWQPRGNSPESLLEETNQESLTHQTWFQSGLHSLAPCCQERLFSK